MSTLTTPHRRLLETAVKHARWIATEGARKSLEALAVHEPEAYPHMGKPQLDLRSKLLAQSKQLGDGENLTLRGASEIKHLVEKLAYDQWHRLLFARYLLENQLLISPEHRVAVSLDDCEELAPSQGLKDSWAVAARFAAVELPEIFRADDPAGAVELPVEDRKPLIALVTGLPVDVFTAGDSLGWCYQFWQADKKDEVNLAGNKIGADELPSVTQLFTEDYMVDFLLDNTLGAWWAGRCATISNHKFQISNCPTEEDARNAVALPGCPWKYLRFVRASSYSTDDSSPATDHWLPAAGTFDGWPKSASELKCLDPCMGSGHFVVALFERLVALRVAEEALDEADAVDAVIRDNLFGLEIDPRCTQIAAFNLALAAWRRVGHRPLPAMNLACSGLAPNASKDDWLALTALLHGDSPLAGEHDLLGPQGQPMLFDARLASGMSQLYDLFQKAPVLGSLINPRAAQGDLLIAPFHALQPLLEKALARETRNNTAHEMAVTARGLAKAAEILADQFTLIATNVPYLGRGKQDEVLQDYCEQVHRHAKADLATCFVERSLGFCARGGSVALVTPQNWWFHGSSKRLRGTLLSDQTMRLLATLGEEAWQTFGNRGPLAVLMIIDNNEPLDSHAMFGVDALPLPTISEKNVALRTGALVELTQSGHFANPDHRITISEGTRGPLLEQVANSYLGLGTGDYSHYGRCFWELPAITVLWGCLQAGPSTNSSQSGREQIVSWDQEIRRVRGMTDSERDQIHNQDQSGSSAWGQRGIAVSLMRTLRTAAYDGDLFEKSMAVLIPKQAYHLLAIKAFTDSPDFSEAVRRIDNKVMVTNATLAKVPFDLAYWQKVAAEKYPDGLPKPFSSDPTQWLFNGQPKGSDQPLHVAVARLLGYRWPRQTGSSFPDCPALGLDGLEALADEDGIVCLSATKGEAPGAERLRALLAQDLGKLDLATLLASAGPKGSKATSLEDWLRDEFFEQHCALFDNRPFIWHLWDGHKSGFSALVNYHQLNHATLEKLTYAYLGDWIRRQDAAVKAEEAGSDARLQAAKLLQSRLKLILEGEAPYDLFVRWKSLSQQAIGWHPDLNDGVRMNIRPFMATDIPGGKKGAGLFRTKPNIKWDKDRGKEPQRDKAEFPWFWKGNTASGDRVNDVNLTRDQKEKAGK